MVPTPLVLSEAIVRQIEAEGNRAYPNECCGILIGRDVTGVAGNRRVVDRLLPGRNVFEADEQYHRFSIDPRQQLQAEREAEKEGKVVLGFYHSHPDHPARPSEYDREHGWPFYSYVIVAIAQDSGGPPGAVQITSWVMNEHSRTFQRQEIVIGTWDAGK
jgi:proteasome lid subunit RPN8/RPN11